jgi:hypothetical protein
MNRKECREIRQQIDQSELGQRLHERVQRHLTLCAACQSFQRERTQLRELVGSLEPVVAPPDFDVHLRARIARAQESNAKQPLIFRFVTGTPAIATAMALLAVLAAAVWLVQRQNNQSPSLDAGIPAVKVPVKPTTPPDQVKQSKFADNESTGTQSPKSMNQVVAKRQGGSKAPANQSSTSSVDLSARQAQILRQIEQQEGEVTLSAPWRPMVVSMQDDQGATRTISLPPVSFGSQRLGNNRTQVSMANPKSRLW